MASAMSDRKLAASLSPGSGFAGPRTSYAGGDTPDILEDAEGVLEELTTTVSLLIIADGPFLVPRSWNNGFRAVSAHSGSFPQELK